MNRKPFPGWSIYVPVVETTGVVISVSNKIRSASDVVDQYYIKTRFCCIQYCIILTDATTQKNNCQFPKPSSHACQCGTNNNISLIYFLSCVNKWFPHFSPYGNPSPYGNLSIFWSWHSKHGLRLYCVGTVKPIWIAFDGNSFKTG